MLYSVKYKAPGWWFWRTLRNVKGDGVLKDSNGSGGSPVGVRYFILHDDRRIELPTTFMFLFDKSRFLFIQNNIKNQAGR